ncbi:hypothetical protein MVLG_00135 [Microbotryum lychnidis-dioicae p1A1 Lamole]|uniref:AB hydrolase-1 domain-containing protein n=1 Tax=Microbotryum lychnidis-dioicae (strain p1A1 Lamole / MvSl-1064) TaxID=683840 RepID=U5GY64_USTV1|nr:hypothetical protein MVLG_00135 [Microbotryum lychnidis-dioicae p1A1 Lamole]|eukprot:KDE09733.1 hypothetical protein MVLG_00135 [Microbotryum lychnidis-dioicae p1A1 Lamole]
MFPDLLVIRIALRILFLVLDSIAPFSLAWTVASIWLWPVHPLVALWPIDHLDLLLRHDFYLHNIVTGWCFIESIWWFFHTIGRHLVARGYWDFREAKQPLVAEERWRLWVKMLESFPDPWEWLGGTFLAPGLRSAPLGMEDPAITRVRIQDVGRSNIEQFVAHFMFNQKLRLVKLGSIERLEIDAMIKLLEIALGRTRGGEFKFLKGRSPHRVFLVNDQPIHTSHHPAIFYVTIWFASELGNIALWLGGFKYYGPKRSWPFPFFFMRGSRRQLDALHDPFELEAMGRSTNFELANRVGYWFHPGSQQAQQEGLTPILFFHGISGTYGPTPFILHLQYCTGRPVILPEFPYVTMRLSPPSAIRTRVETVAMARRALWRHGFGLANDTSDSVDPISGDEDDDEDWRRARCVVVGHSLGGGTSGWILRDAPDIVAGMVLLDPMSIVLFAADGPRNFFRTRVRTAGQIFFKYFALERGINHFLLRHLRWTDSVIFGPNPNSALPEEAKRAIVPRAARTEIQVPFDRPNYAQWISACPNGPIPSQVFLSERDCILNVPGKLVPYLRGSGFEEGKNLFIMPGEHAAVLISPFWCRKIAQAVKEVADAGEKVLYELLEEEEKEIAMIGNGSGNGNGNGNGTSSSGLGGEKKDEEKRQVEEAQ